MRDNASGRIDLNSGLKAARLTAKVLFICALPGEKRGQYIKGSADPSRHIHGSKRSLMAKPKRAWQRMLSGRRLDLLDPTPVDIEVEDIAHGLAFVARWNGQTHGDYAYSVAEHSLLVETLFSRVVPKAPAKWRLAALLHDAPEYVIGDMISPVKAAVGPDYEALDDRLTAAVHIRFGLPAAIPLKIKAQIKKADKISAWMEATQIAGFSETEASRFFGKPDVAIMDALQIVLRPPVETRRAFTDRHLVLLEEME